MTQPRYSTVAELLESPERWCQGMNAQNAAGQYALVRSHDACRWCLRGAVALIYGDEMNVAWAKLKEAIGVAPGDSLIPWNDAPERTHAEVLAAVRKAGI